MTNKTITLSRELAERLANPKDCDDGYFQDIERLRAALAEPVPPAVETVQGHHPSCRAVDEYKPGDCSHGCAPVPPAGGEPEVVGRQCFPSEEMAKVKAYRKAPWVDDGVGQQPRTPGFYRVEPLIRLSDHQAIATRLQAEVGHLSLKVSEYDYTCDAVYRERDALQTELTKARELLADAPRGVPGFGSWTRRVIEYLSNQSAPADKGGYGDDAPCPECGSRDCNGQCFGDDMMGDS